MSQVNTWCPLALTDLKMITKDPKASRCLRTIPGAAMGPCKLANMAFLTP